MNNSVLINQKEKPFQARSRWRAYLELTKPKVVLLMLLTALVGICLGAPSVFPWQQAIYGLLGIALMAGSAAAVNHLIDRNIDQKMARTHKRPLPQGEISPANVLLFALLLGGIGFAFLIIKVNAITAWLTLASLVGYAVLYTLYLKRATPQNIVIAGLAGAMPPLLGWTTVTGQMSAQGWLLVMIVFIWTPPHFWALAVHRVADYQRAKIPMLPVTHGVEYTKTSILLYTVLMTLVCLLPYLIGMSGILYLLASLVLNTGFMLHAWKLKFNPSEKTAMETFKYSIYQLMLLFAALLLDHYTRST
ncbi:protoheme IX farnesyltransferase [Vibrio sp. SM6]|uniref:Protoheme IX farnesyltransferase n=1 Tax=Vibrio agarilyticus TaxID=2726741 RepID=A0A7X8TS71_9VIBR|nr:heme o synthase [Vibrio agarilyticus]NLS13804.1 protoheme IX farnesyltransferase [Vibrio agarilyticus]